MLERPYNEKELPLKMKKHEEVMQDFYNKFGDDPEKWDADAYYFLNRKFMREEWGVDDLSNLEDYQLKKITKEVVEQYGKEKQEGIGRLMNPEQEAAYRWLWELYDIDRVNVPQNLVFVDEDAGIEKVFYPSEKELYPQEVDQAEEWAGLKHGHETPAEFKEYLRRLREKAHLI